MFFKYNQQKNSCKKAFESVLCRNNSNKQAEDTTQSEIRTFALRVSD